VFADSADVGMEIFDILSALAAARGPSGHEGGAAARARQLFAPLADETWTDGMGNLFALKRCGRANAETVLIDAHLDEIGFMVAEGENGFFKFRPIGSIDARLWPGTEVVILADPPVSAVVSCLPPHLTGKDARDKVAPVSELFLDTGGAAVKPGSTGVFASRLARMGDCAAGAAMDNRAGLASAVLAMRTVRSPAYDVLVCGSVQEEVGMRGTAAAAHGLRVSAALVLDVTYGQGSGAKEDAFPLGGGVCVNRGPDCNRALTERLIATAKAQNIPHQIEVTCGMSRTNATALQTAGIAAAVLSVPLRYMHTPVETLCLRDIEAAARLVCAYLEGL